MVKRYIGGQGPDNEVLAQCHHSRMADPQNITLFCSTDLTQQLLPLSWSASWPAIQYQEIVASFGLVIFQSTHALA